MDAPPSARVARWPWRRPTASKHISNAPPLRRNCWRAWPEIISAWRTVGCDACSNAMTTSPAWRSPGCPQSRHPPPAPFVDRLAGWLAAATRSERKSVALLGTAMVPPGHRLHHRLLAAAFLLDLPSSTTDQLFGCHPSTIAASAGERRRHLAWLQQVLGTLRRPDGTVMFLLDGAGHYLAHHNAPCSGSAPRRPCEALITAPPIAASPGAAAHPTSPNPHGSTCVRYGIPHGRSACWSPRHNWIHTAELLLRELVLGLLPMLGSP